MPRKQKKKKKIFKMKWLKFSINNENIIKTILYYKNEWSIIARNEVKNKLTLENFTILFVTRKKRK